MTSPITRRRLATYFLIAAAMVAAIAMLNPGPRSPSGVSMVPASEGESGREDAEVGSDRMALPAIPDSANPALALEPEGIGLSVRCIDGQGTPIEANLSVFRGVTIEARAVPTIGGLATIVLRDWNGCLLNASSDSGAFGTLKVVGSMVQEASATIVLREPAVLAGKVLAPALSLESGGKISALRVNPSFRESLGDDFLRPPDQRPDGTWATADIEADGSFRITGLEHGGYYRLCVDAPGILAQKRDRAFQAPDEQLVIQTEFLYAGTLELVEDERGPRSIVIDNGGMKFFVLGDRKGFKGPFMVDLLQWTHSASYASAPAVERNKKTLWFASESNVLSADLAIEVKFMGFPDVKASLHIEPCDGRPSPVTQIRYGANPVRGSISLILRPSAQSAGTALDPAPAGMTYDGALMLANLANSEEFYEIPVHLTPPKAHLVEGIPAGEYSCSLKGRRGAPSLPFNSLEWTNLVVGPGVNELAFVMPPVGQVELIVEIPEDRQVPALGRRLWEGPLALDWIPLGSVRYVEDGTIGGGPAHTMVFSGPPYLIPAIVPDSYAMKARHPECVGNLVHALDGSVTEFWTLEAVAEKRIQIRTQMKPYPALKASNSNDVISTSPQ